jgi:deoxyribonuclease IV
LISKYNIGLHLRLKNSLTQTLQEAISLNLPSFQFFLTKQTTGKYITLNHKDIDEFCQLKKSYIGDIFIHSSYWINPATSNKDAFNNSKLFLRRELKIAKKLEIKYLVLHAGSAKGHRLNDDDPTGKKYGIQTVVKILNNVLKHEPDVFVLLENSAHGKQTIGNDFMDLALIREGIDFPERIGFCLDTAHAFSYGYNLDPIDEFLELMDKTIGIDNIQLIHFNDTFDAHGSMQDRHALPGQGKIGTATLLKFINHPRLLPIPKIIEHPNSSKNELDVALESFIQHV